MLEIGTGTGYDAALLCHALGNQCVASVDIDAALVEAAGRRLANLGYDPVLRAGDGAEGFAGGGSFDRIIATCSMPKVPAAWIEQTVPGGMILVSLYREFGGGPLALLQVADGRASGHFEPYSAGFMPTRNLARVPPVSLLPSEEDRSGQPAEDGDFQVTPELLSDEDFAMIAALLVDAQRVTLLPEDQPEQLWLVGRNGSWAYRTVNENGKPVVRQGGAERLWDEIEAIAKQWNLSGRPRRQDYGLTVTKDGRHIIWCKDSGNEIGLLG